MRAYNEPEVLKNGSFDEDGEVTALTYCEALNEHQYLIMFLADLENGLIRMTTQEYLKMPYTLYEARMIYRNNLKPIEKNG